MTPGKWLQNYLVRFPGLSKVLQDASLLHSSPTTTLISKQSQQEDRRHIEGREGRWTGQAERSHALSSSSLVSVFLTEAASLLSLLAKPSLLPVFFLRFSCSPQILVPLLLPFEMAVTPHLKRTSVCPADVCTSFTFSPGQPEKQTLTAKSGVKCLSLSILLLLLYVPRQSKKPPAS